MSSCGSRVKSPQLALLLAVIYFLLFNHVIWCLFCSFPFPLCTGDPDDEDWHKAGKGPDPAIAALDRQMDDYFKNKASSSAAATDAGQPAAAPVEAATA